MQVDKTFGAPEKGEIYRDREGAYLLAVRDGMLAVADTPKGWFLPGGGIDEGETHGECICRECLEELGYAARVGEYIGCAEAFTRINNVEPFHPVQYFYAGALGEKTQEPTEPDHALRWVPVEEAERKMYLEWQRWAVCRLLERGY